jgi:hypothetical protein
MKSMRRLVRLMPMRVLHIEPDDILVLQTDLNLTKEQCIALRKAADYQFGKENFKKIAILTSGLKVGVLRKKKNVARRTKA